MKNNSIYWKTSCFKNASNLVNQLRDKYLVIRLVERKNNKLKTIYQFDAGMQYPNIEGINKQIEFINSHKPSNMHQFYIIFSVN